MTYSCNPKSSPSPSMMFRFWTAAPDAPLPRLSSRATRHAVPRASLSNTNNSKPFDPFNFSGSKKAPRSNKFASVAPDNPRGMTLTKLLPCVESTGGLRRAMTRALHAIEQTQVQATRRVDGVGAGAVDLRYDSRTAWYRVMRRERRVELVALGDTTTVPPINDRHGDDHALGEGAHGGEEDWRLLQSPMKGHLR